MFNFFKAKQMAITAPIEGVVIPLTKVKDLVFASEMMGKGFGIKPSGDEIVSPVEGKVASIFPTKHAIMIETIKGTNVLIHIGIDTVELEGKGFSILVNKGDKLSAGDLLAIVDFDYLTLRGKDPTVICVFPEFTGELEVNYQKAAKAEPIGSLCP